MPFTDVAEGAWYYDAVAYVCRGGLMMGTDETTFSPDNAATRGQLVTIRGGRAGPPVHNTLRHNPAGPAGAGGAVPVRWAASEGVVTGYGNGAFGPDDPVTREQLAVMLYRCAQHLGRDVSIGQDTNILSYTDAFDVSEYAAAALQWACGAGIIRGTGDGSTLTPPGRGHPGPDR